MIKVCDEAGVKTKILRETNKFKMAMYKTNKILQRMEEKREKEVKVNDGSSGSPVSEETSANIEEHMN